MTRHDSGFLQHVPRDVKNNCNFLNCRGIKWFIWNKIHPLVSTTIQSSSDKNIDDLNTVKLWVDSKKDQNPSQIESVEWRHSKNPVYGKIDNTHRVHRYSTCFNIRGLIQTIRAQDMHVIIYKNIYNINGDRWFCLSYRCFCLFKFDSS